MACPPPRWTPLYNGYIVTVTNGLCNETQGLLRPDLRSDRVIPFLGSLVGVLLFTIFPNLP